MVLVLVLHQKSPAGASDFRSAANCVSLLWVGIQMDCNIGIRNGNFFNMCDRSFSIILLLGEYLPQYLRRTDMGRHSTPYIGNVRTKRTCSL